MQKKIHPKYYAETKITCACGNVIKVGSTKEAMETEICSACHPFYTGKKKVVDSAGQVDRFKKRMEKSTLLKKQTVKKKIKSKAKKAKTSTKHNKKKTSPKKKPVKK